MPAAAATASGRVRVESDPAGATVAVDGAPRGVAPVEVTGLDLGSHEVKAELKGYDPKTESVVLTSDASHFYRNVETRQPVQIITSLPEMLDAFDTIDTLAGAAKLVVAGHDPQVSQRFKEEEPGIVKIA